MSMRERRSVTGLVVLLGLTLLATGFMVGLSVSRADGSEREAHCAALAQQIYETQDYTGSPGERACFGEEDDPRVGLALDNGLTVAGYKAYEALQRKG